MWLASSFVSLRLDSVSLYFRISFVFQTDSLYQFLFKACPPSGVRGLLTSLFSICPSCYDCLCGSHLPVALRPRTCLSCYDLALSLIWYYWHFWHCGITPVLLALWFSEELPPPLSCNQTNV